MKYCLKDNSGIKGTSEFLLNDDYFQSFNIKSLDLINNIRENMFSRDYYFLTINNCDKTQFTVKFKGIIIMTDTINQTLVKIKLIVMPNYFELY